MKLPIEWSHLYVGDRIHSTMPFHRIKAGMRVMRKQGFKYDTEPSPRGYWLICTDSPNVSPYKAKTEAA